MSTINIYLFTTITMLNVFSAYAKNCSHTNGIFNITKLSLQLTFQTEYTVHQKSPAPLKFKAVTIIATLNNTVYTVYTLTVLVRPEY